MAAHSSILAWEIPWIEEPGGLQSMGSQRVGQDLATKTPTATKHKEVPAGPDIQWAGGGSTDLILTEGLGCSGQMLILQCGNHSHFREQHLNFPLGNHPISYIHAMRFEWGSPHAQGGRVTWVVSVVHSSEYPIHIWLVSISQL